MPDARIIQFSGEPAEGTVEAADGTAKPAEGTVEPAEGTVEPAEGTVEPAEGTVEPAEGTVERSRPVGGTGEPDRGAENGRHASPSTAKPAAQPVARSVGDGSAVAGSGTGASDGSDESVADGIVAASSGQPTLPDHLRDLGRLRPDPGAEQVDAGSDDEARHDDDEPAGDDAEAAAPRDEWERRVAGALSFLRRRLTGEYKVDEFGFDAELTETVLAAPLRPLYDKWFRVEVTGLENVPSEGGALVVANHSGVIALDGVITSLALLDHHPARRHMRMLGADLVFATPFLGQLARKAGHTLACQADAERLLSAGELVGVYPEGFKGVGKPFSERYKLQRFGRGGFVSAALATKAPIVPCAIVGAEEIYPMLGNAKLLARLLGLPYFPLTPTFPWLGPLGMIPLPSKWYIEFGEPIDTASLAGQGDDPMIVFNVTDQVRETIQQTLYRLLMKRTSVFN